LWLPFISYQLTGQVNALLLGALISTLRISAFLCDSAVIGFCSSFTVETQSTQSSAEKISKVGNDVLLNQSLVKTRMTLIAS
jgi:hypothetical protein